MKTGLNKRVCAWMFMMLLLVAEVFSAFGDGSAAKINENKDTVYTISFRQSNGTKEAVYTAGFHHSGRDDIEINRNFETINNRILAVRGKFHSYKHNRRFCQDDGVFFRFSSLLLALWFYLLRIFIVWGAAVSFSLRFIIKYIYHKNGEKIDRFLSITYEHFIFMSI